MDNSGGAPGSASVVATFDSRAEADEALSRLRSSGVATDSISVDSTEPPVAGVGADLGSNVAGAAIVGAIAGIVIGALVAWATSIGTAALPGAGPYSGISSPAAAITGAVLGAAIGGIIGGLVGLRIPRLSQAEIEEHERNTRVLVTVETSIFADPSRVEQVLRASGAEDVRAYGQTPAVVEAEALEEAAEKPQADAAGEGESAAEVENDAEVEAHLPPGAEVGGGWMAAMADDSPAPYEEDGMARDAEAADDMNDTGDADGTAAQTYDPVAATVADDSPETAKMDVDASTGEPNWYEAMPHLPVTPAPQGEATYSGMSKDEETFADLQAMEAESQQEDTLNDNPEGTNPNTVTGTQGAIDPDTGTFGTAGTPLTTGYGASGSTIGTGSTGGEVAHESGDFEGEVPDSKSYDMGGRGSTDSRRSLEGAERDLPVADKYEGQTIDAAPAQGEKPVLDIYQQGPSYGGESTPNLDRTQLYSSADVDAPPSYANTPTEEAHESSGTNIPGTADIRGLGDNTDDPNDPDSGGPHANFNHTSS